MKGTALVIVSAAVASLWLGGCAAPSEEGVAQKRPEGPVPDVVGEPFGAACRTLQNNGYLVAYEPRRIVEDGEPVSVTAQEPKAGEETHRNGVVRLTLSGAPPRQSFTPEGSCGYYSEITLGQ